MKPIEFIKIVTVITIILGHSNSAHIDVAATVTSLTSMLTQCSDWLCMENGIANIWPISPILKQPPASCIKFYAYYWDYLISSTDYQSSEIIIGDASTMPRQWNFTADARLLIHGWAQDRTGVMPANLIDEFMRNETSANIVAVDWSCLATTLACSLVSTSGILIAAKLLLNYLIAVANTQIVGKYICQFLLWQYALGSMAPQNTHLIGHSLGAHISGIAGNCVMSSTSGIQIRRITGLDPAGPCFYSGKLGTSLSPADAAFVDGIHTDAGCLGLPLRVGHVDFYPNGGTAMQPNCLNQIFDDLSNITPLQLFLATCLYPFLILGCNHFKSVYYFIASITGNYPAYPCPSAGTAMSSGNLVCKPAISSKSPTVFMGEQCSPYANGSYYLPISSTN